MLQMYVQSLSAPLIGPAHTSLHYAALNKSDEALERLRM